MPGGLEAALRPGSTLPHTMPIEETSGASDACSTLPLPCPLDDYAQKALGVGSALALPAHMDRYAPCNIDAVVRLCTAASYNVQGGIATTLCARAACHDSCYIYLAFDCMQ